MCTNNIVKDYREKKKKKVPHTTMTNETLAHTVCLNDITKRDGSCTVPFSKKQALIIRERYATKSF